MPKIDVNGIGIAYDIIGDGEQSAIITPGGRFTKDTPGVRQLAEKLAEGGLKTVIWDRPNCGESDISFAGETESIQNADALAGLLRALGGVLGLLQGDPAQRKRAGLALPQAEIEDRIAARAAAKARRDFAAADRIRDALLEQGIVLKDSPAGTTWEVRR